MPSLKILGAAYGLGDVTAVVRGKIESDTLSVRADNATFGDQFLGERQSLVVAYQYDNQLPQISIVEEGSRMNISYIPTATYRPNPGTLTILGAAYGLGEMTSKVQSMVANNNLNFTADSKTFFNTFPGHCKSMVIVYLSAKDDKTKALMHISKEGTTSNIS